MEGLMRCWRELVPVLGPHGLKHFRSHHHLMEKSRRLVLSRFFQPMNLREDMMAGLESKFGELTCRSQYLMLKAGLICPGSPGCYSLMPYTVRAMEKLIKVIDDEMQAIGGQKLNLPSLGAAELWKRSERWDLMGKELFRLADRHSKEYCLGPTHEETVTDLIASQGTLSYKQLPLLLYQITRKFRDEPKPRFGLLRSREFYMKDMYTFDVSEEAAHLTYNMVCAAYSRLLKRLGLQFVMVQADTGNIGGKKSHEFQLPASIGEDRILVCSSCSFSTNVDAISSGHTECPECKGTLSETKGIEVGHTFYLGTKYSSVFNACFSSAQGKPVVAEMGCYGLGVTRILAAAIEVLSTEDSIRWPSLIAPFQACLIPPKKGSKEETSINQTESLYDDIVMSLPHLKGETILDDRTHMTIGKRLKDADKLGYPYVIVTGKTAVENPPRFEVWCQNTGEVFYLTREGVLDLLRNVHAV